MTERFSDMLKLQKLDIISQRMILRHRSQKADFKKKV
jgi:hypothetical protein